MHRRVLTAALVLLTALAAGMFASTTPTRAQETARVTILHLAPFAAGVANTAVTVVVNDNVIDPDFRYKDEPIVANLPGGAYTVEVFAGANADTSGDPAITANVTLEAGTDYTVFAGGDGVNIPLGLFPLVDETTAPAAGQAKVRVVHAAPFAAQDATAVDIRTNAAESPLLRDDLTGVEFGQFSNPYVSIPAGVEGLAVNVTSVGGATTIIGPIPATLPDQTVASIFAIGGANGFDPEFLVVPGRIVPGEEPSGPAQLRVVHAAPFAEGSAAVDVVVPGSAPLTLLSGFSFGQTSQDYTPPAPIVSRPGGFIELPANTYPIDVRPAGTETVAISGTFALEAGARYTALALGGANGYPLELVAIEEPAGPPAEGKARIRVYHAAPFGEDTSVSIRTQDRSTVIGGLADVEYKGTAVLEVDPGTYDLVVATPDGSATLIDIPPFTVAAGDELMIIAVGDGVVTANGPAPVQDGPNQPLRTIFLGTQSTFRLYMPLIAN